ncbi:MAG: HIT family protein [Candidatus ainarchaeum sp.]|nr:HIT family protein [Candidatus ainarchaeum sp.]
MPECIFCSIIRGKKPATKVYEDDEVAVIMDIKPITAGHMLVIPKVHRELLTEMDDDSIKAVFSAAKKVGNALKKSKLRCRGINYLLADGAEAGQEVFHAHLHVIPRYRGDGFWLNMPSDYEKEMKPGELEKNAGKIRAAMGK